MPSIVKIKKLISDFSKATLTTDQNCILFERTPYGVPIALKYNETVNRYELCSDFFIDAVYDCINFKYMKENYIIGPRMRKVVLYQPTSIGLKIIIKFECRESYPVPILGCLVKDPTFVYNPPCIHSDRLVTTPKHVLSGYPPFGMFPIVAPQSFNLVVMVPADSDIILCHPVNSHSISKHVKFLPSGQSDFAVGPDRHYVPPLYTMKHRDGIHVLSFYLIVGHKCMWLKHNMKNITAFEHRKTYNVYKTEIGTWEYDEGSAIITNSCI